MLNTVATEKNHGIHEKCLQCVGRHEMTFKACSLLEYTRQILSLGEQPSCSKLDNPIRTSCLGVGALHQNDGGPGPGFNPQLVHYL